MTCASLSTHDRGQNLRAYLGTAWFFVRRGLFRLNYRGWDGLVDPLMAYVRLPGDGQRIAHRPAIEDVCTVLTLDEALVTEVMNGPPPIRPLLTNGRIDLAQRIMVARARQDADGFELAERVTRLAEELFRLADESPTVRRSPAPSHRRLAESAREVLTNNPAWPPSKVLPMSWVSRVPTSAGCSEPRQAKA